MSVTSDSTEDLYKTGENADDEELKNLVKSVEERTVLRLKRSAKFEEKLKELTKRSYKLYQLRLVRLSKKRDHRKFRRTENGVWKVPEVDKVQGNCCYDNALDVAQNLNDQERLNEKLKQLQTF